MRPDTPVPAWPILAMLAVPTMLAIALLFARPATSQEQLPEQSPLITACETARGLAANSNLNMESCRRVSEVVEGNTALVTVVVKITGQGKYFVSVNLYRSVWGQTSLVVKPA